MSLASLGVGTPAWRAGQVASALAAVLRGDVAADDALDVLASVGEPAGGWWAVLGQARQAQSVALLLPRPGDPRGIALPRGLGAEAAVGWGDGRVSAWLLPTGTRAWESVELIGQGVPTRDVHDADRQMRESVVELAHLLDVVDRSGPASTPEARRDVEATVDAWVLGAARLPSGRRQLASVGLRMLLALEGARSIVDVGSLEAAARTAVEAAYSLTHASG